MIRRITETFLSQVCTLTQEQDATGTYGEQLHEFVIVAEDVACRLISLGQRLGSAIAEAGAQETMRSEYRLIIGRDTALEADMQVVIGENTYNVVRIDVEWTSEVFHSAIVYKRD